MSTAPSSYVNVQRLRHRYGERTALDGVEFNVAQGEMFAVLGPNGGGKTTLFKILATLLRPTEGDALIDGVSLIRDPAAVRRRLGVVFQKPSVDGKLTVHENILCHGHLYGITGSDLANRSQTVLERLGLADRARDYVETLSGGLQRRVELAKALLHRPPLLLLDEPSTGLDPGARRDFIAYLGELRRRDGMTVVLTTHFMDEAEQCDRVAIIHRGSVASIGTPAELKAAVGGDVVVLHSPAPTELASRIAERFGLTAKVVDGALRIERAAGHEFVRDVVDAFPEAIETVTYGKPTLEDAFVRFTGHRFWGDASESAQ